MIGCIDSIIKRGINDETQKDSSEQKLRGAYYTPLQLADAMVELFASQNISTVLEPSCGDGVFLDALQNLNLLNKVDKLTAVEIEPDEAEKVRDRYSEFEQIEVCTEDFSTSIIVSLARNSMI